MQSAAEAAAAADVGTVATIASDGRMRFLLELEFVELLANPWYLQSLAQQKYLDDPRFVAYVAYLQYWRTPEYIHYISHPHALHFLEMLQQPQFRAKLHTPAFIDTLHNNQYWHWKVHSRVARRVAHSSILTPHCSALPGEPGAGTPPAKHSHMILHTTCDGMRDSSWAELVAVRYRSRS